MPTIYEWTVPLPAGSGGAVAPSGPGIGTGVDGRRAYAVTREMDPMTGDVVFDATRRTWATGAPLTERVLRCLRTERGTAARDPSYGVDWSAVDNARTNSGVAAQQAITEALRRFVDAGDLRDLRVLTDSIPAASGRAFLFKVTFRDVRGETFALNGRPE